MDPSLVPFIPAAGAVLAVLIGQAISSIVTLRLAQRTFERQRQLAQEEAERRRADQETQELNAFQNKRQLAVDESRRRRREQQLQSLLAIANSRLGRYRELRRAVTSLPPDVATIDKIIEETWRQSVLTDLSHLTADDQDVRASVLRFAGTDGRLRSLWVEHGGTVPQEPWDDAMNELGVAIRDLNRTAESYILKLE